MPVIYHCGFNGLTMPLSDSYAGLSSTGTSNPVGLQSANNLLNNYFGVGGAEPNGGGAVSFRRSVTNAYAISANNFFSWSIAPAKLEPNVPALTFSGHRHVVSSSLDTRQGMRFHYGHLFPSGEFWECVFGFRLWVSGATNLNRYSFDIHALTGNENSSATGTGLYSAPYADLAGKDTYVELVVKRSVAYPNDPNRRDLELYMDDVLVKTLPNASNFHGVMVQTESYVDSGKTPFEQRIDFYQFRDLYLMAVEGDTDVRIGSSATVVGLPLAADDEVQFQRPDGYDSNSSVAGLPMVLAPGEVSSRPTATAVLVGEEPGQQDTYSIDASPVRDKLGTIDSVRIRSAAMNPLLGQRTFSTIAVSGGAVEKETLALATGNNFQQSTIHMAAEPESGNRWSLGKLADLKVGTRFES